MQKIISVFGSARPLPQSAAYQTAYRVGRLLAESGYTVATGGYDGTMGAVSSGAADGGGHVIGVTCGQIERQFGRVANEWVCEEVKYPTLRERLLHLVQHNDGMIALPGGIGTLSEWSLAWSFLQTGEIEIRPLILLGDGWQRTVNAMAHSDYVKESDQTLLSFAYSPQDCLALLKQVD